MRLYSYSMTEKDTTIWKEYVDGLAKELAAVGEQASLLGHPSLTGDAREDAIHRFFQRILPDSIGTTSGRVFDRKGKRSAEMDLILYDRHFPLIRIGHDCLVPVEAAIALFEIKSELNSEAVKDALKKCRSVADLLKRYHRLNRIGDMEIRHEDLTVSDRDQLSPAFYVYGFKGFTGSVEPLQRTIGECIGQAGSRRSFVPRVISTPTCVGMRKRDDIYGCKPITKKEISFSRLP